MISITPFLFVVLLAAVENAVIPTDDTDNRILGGEEASITEFPSMAFLSKGIYVCGAVIISEKWVLTAAHCVEGATGSNVILRVGSSNKNHYGSVHRSSRIITHEEYVHEEEYGRLVDVQNDIALVEVEEPFPLDNLTIKAARLALQDEDIRPGSLVTIAGWGRTEGGQRTNILYKANLEIISRQTCRKYAGPLTIDRRLLCARDSAGKRTCPVENPFVLNNVTIKAARLPLQNEDTPEDTIVTAVGWGNMEDEQQTNILHKANLKIVSRQECTRFKPVDERYLCAMDSRREKSTCSGDSGGPLFNKDVVVGVVSVGPYSCTRFFLSVNPSNTFTRVAYFRDWIKQNTGI